MPAITNELCNSSLGSVKKRQKDHLVHLIKHHQVLSRKKHTHKKKNFFLKGLNGTYFICEFFHKRKFDWNNIYFKRNLDGGSPHQAPPRNVVNSHTLSRLSLVGEMIDVWVVCCKIISPSRNSIFINNIFMFEKKNIIQNESLFSRTPQDRLFRVGVKQ